MSPAPTEEKVAKFREMVNATERVGVSEFARSKSWRERLPEAGCFEVVDRNGVVGYMLAPDYALALSDRIAELESQAEEAQIATMFKVREGRNDLKGGADLKASALDYFDQHAAALGKIIDGD